MPNKVFINGDLVDRSQATVSVFDHGLLYGDGVFEGIRVYGGVVFRLSEHVDRLYESAVAIRLEIAISRQEMCQAVNDTVAVNGIDDGYVRLVVTRGAGYLGLDVRKTSDPRIIVIADTITLYPDEFYEHGLSIITASTIRNHSAALNPQIKSLNYLNNILAKIEATDAGCQEALMLNHKGEVAECTGENIFIVKDGVVKTPPGDAGILMGITRNAVIELAERTGRSVSQVTLSLQDISTADECFLTGTAAEVVPVVQLDGQTIGNGKPGPITQELLRAFHRLVRGE